MKNKNINLAVAILACLVISSFAFYVVAQEKANNGNNIFIDSDQDGLTDDEEKTYGTNPHNSDSDNDGYSDGAEVKSGYNPMIAAPNDKVFEPADVSSKNNQAVNGDNMTQKVASKIMALTPDEKDQEVNLDEIKSMVDETLSSKPKDADAIPDIKKSDLKVKDQSYKKLSDKETEAQKKEDFANYITSIFYIISSNSPKPITSTSDITSVSAQISQTIMGAIDKRDPAALDDLSKSGEKMIEQMKEVEVPEELVDIHIKALRFAYYAKSLKKYIGASSEDPLGDIANFSQMDAFIGSLSDFSSEAQAQFSKYGLTFDSDTQSKLKDMGVDLSGIDAANLISQ